MAAGLLEGRVAVVTGAGQGLGRAIAREYAQEGATVALLERNAEGLADTARLIEGEGGRALPHQLDVTDADAYERVVADIVKAAGRVDILVNNAAIALYGTILEDRLEDWRAQIAVNLEAVYVGSKLVAPTMVSQRSGRIISIASTQAIATSGEAGAYTAAKGGIISYTKSMAVELAPHGILVNAIAPGFMRTPMSFIDGVDETTTEEFTSWYIDRRKVPLARAGLPEDIAGTAVFLASGYCRYLTGQTLIVDGGLTSTF